MSLYGRLSDSARTCDCGARMFAPGFFSFEALRRADLGTENLDLQLTALGFCAGDVISVSSGAGTTRHFEITGRAVQ